MTDPEQRPDSFTVEYRGNPWVFTRLKDQQGYGYQLEPNGAYHWIETESGARHALTFDAQGRATIRGSLAHPGLHVVITDGVANDV
jgi:hypothetical protein